ncbi:MAG TPA: IclR family transcriptional regulator [Solirubrobacteraceae bacterium]|nr:IclR family transcriptional regulator [Solirubrobacteraceae bacterium]
MPVSNQSIARASSMLRLLASCQRQLTVAELASQLELSKGTAFGILRTLHAEGLVEQDRESRRYRLGPGLLVLGAAYRERNELLARAFRLADELAARLEHTVRLGTLYDDRVLVLHHVASAAEAEHRSDVGSLLPLASTALGRVLLSGCPALAGRCLDGARDRDAGHEPRIAELCEIAARGWTWLTGDLGPRQTSVAAAIRDQDGEIAGAIAISGPPEHLVDDGAPPRALVDELVGTAATMSRELGFRNGW